jgi:hypothetical protein
MALDDFFTRLPKWIHCKKMIVADSLSSKQGMLSTRTVLLLATCVASVAAFAPMTAGPALRVTPAHVRRYVVYCFVGLIR